MFETSIANLVFVALAAALFIGRTIAAARKRKEESAPDKPRTPIFVDEDDEIPGYLKPGREVVTQPAVQVSKAVIPPPKKKTPSLAVKAPVPKAAMQQSVFNPAVPAKESTVVKPIVRNAQTSSPQNDFTIRLSHLPPLKQAVVMAEILGKPKAFS